MGLLSQILGGMAGGRAGGLPGGLPGGLGGGLGGGLPGAGRGGLDPMLLALLPVVLQMLSRRQRGGAAMPGGGLGGGLGGMGGMGGLAGILQGLSQRGYGSQVQSWVGTGQNEPMPVQAVDDLFDEQELSQMASQAGLSRDETREGLSQLLPEVVDDLTPEGQLPPQEQLLSSIDDYARRMP